ncbi:MAG: phosphate ABC transporter substrate-binding protein [Cyanobacteria bacterium P01_G01_bin.54]
MAEKNNTLPLILALLVTGGVIAGGFLLLTGGQRQFEINGVDVSIGDSDSPEQDTDSSSAADANSSDTATTSATPFPVPTEVASGTQIFIDGSTSMAQINAALKESFEGKFTGTRVEIAATGSSNGIAALIAGDVDVAASSRPLKPEEASAGLKTVVVAPDQIALVIGKDNSFKGALTTQQVADIFTGKITNWSAIGGEDAPIRVINRPAVSGTYSAFKEIVLQGQDVMGPGVTTLERDETTGLLQQLGTDGIGYATYNQVATQGTVRTLSVDNVFPGDASYPYERELLYVYKDPASDAVKSFLGFLGAPEVQSAIAAE